MQRDALPTDLTDDQWAAVEPLIPPPVRVGRKREVNLREVVNAIRHLLATDCRWRGLPAGFPNRSTVRHYYDAWRESGVWEQIEKAVGAAGKTASSPDCAGCESAQKPDDRTS
jgi:putative transposase